MTRASRLECSIYISLFPHEDSRFKTEIHGIMKKKAKKKRYSNKKRNRIVDKVCLETVKNSIYEWQLIDCDTPNISVRSNGPWEND